MQTPASRASAPPARPAWKAEGGGGESACPEAGAWGSLHAMQHRADPSRPRPANSMEFHGAVQWAGAESTEWVLFGRPLGLLFGVGCCSALLADSTMAGFPGDGDCGPWTT